MENMAPHLRTTGVFITMELRYHNKHDEVGKEVDGPDGEKIPIAVVCDAIVRVTPEWNSRSFKDYSSFSNLGAQRRSRGRYTYGVTVAVEKTGEFEYFDWAELFNSLMNSLVVFTIPLMVVNCLALQCIGTTSKIYRNLLEPTFSILNQFHSMAAGMMVGASTFRSLTGQPYTPLEDLKPMELDRLTSIMAETLADKMEVTEEHPKAELCLDEVTRMAGVVMHNFTGSVEKETCDMYDFIKGQFNNEAFTPELFALFADKDRKRYPLERLFDCTWSEMEEIWNMRMRASKSVSEIATMPESEAMQGERPKQEEEQIVAVGQEEQTVAV